jgi:hypothetical protein
MADESPPMTEKNDGEPAEQPRRNRKLAAGLAFGIGSAAIVAALLYTSRSKAQNSDS